MRASRNVELKAGNIDPAEALSVCESLGAKPHGLLVQEDTYFHVSVGRLKLREERDAAAHLIAYQRPDHPGRRESSYRMAPVADPATLKSVLSAALGVQAVITKKRRLFTLGSVRIHLDAVDGLGSFVEFEAVASSESNLSKEREDLQMLREAFAISDADLIGVSYCDLLVAIEQDKAALDEPIRLVPYDLSWPERFDRERAALDAAVGIWATGGVHHVGSTAVPGLDAKPIIDILVGVDSLDASRACFEPLAKLGYLYAPYRTDEMHWFCKPHPSRRTHHLHLVPRDSSRFRDELAFRDLLRASAEIAQEYAALKRDLVERFTDDREAYTDAKAEFIVRILRRP